MKLRGISLSMRITFWALLLVGAGGALWINKENQQLNELYLRERSSDLEVALQVEQTRLAQSIETLRQDVLFLSNTPPIYGMVRAAANHGIDPRDKDSYASWEGRLQEIFAAYLRAHPDYFHVRLIGVADGGKELVRVENNDGRIEAVPHEMLQVQGDKDYFQAGLQLTVGRVQLSEFTFEQELGRPGAPQRPALHAVTPVFDAGGHVFGLVVINKDVHPLFALSATALPPGVQGFITNQHGNYLFRLDGRHAAGAEVPGQEKITDAFPSLKVLFDAQTTQNDLALHAVSGPEGGYLAAKRVFFDASDPTRFLLLVYHIPPSLIAKQVSTGIPLPNLADTVLVMLLVIGVFMLILRRTFAPLKRLTIAARRIAAGDQAHLSEKGGGEIGELVEALNSMMEKLSGREVIERENAFRKELIELLPGVFYMIDGEGRFLMWNRNLELVLQRSGEEIASCHPLDFFGGEDKVNVEHAMRRVFEQGEASVEAELVAKDGSRTPFHFAGRRVVRDGKPVLIGMGLDQEQHASTRAMEALGGGHP